MEFKFSAAEPFFRGHYPGSPVTPGVILIDRAVLAAEKMLGRKIVLTGMKKVKFSSPVLPDEVVSLTLELRAEGEMAYSFFKDSAHCASGVLLFRNMV